jgi:hypothetical protein
MVAMMIIGPAVAAILGFAAGLVTIKRSERWCPACGETLRCVHCPGRPTPTQTRRSLHIASSSR